MGELSSFIRRYGVGLGSLVLAIIAIASVILSVNQSIALTQNELEHLNEAISKLEGVLTKLEEQIIQLKVEVARLNERLEK